MRVRRQLGKSPATRTDLPFWGHADDEPDVGVSAALTGAGADELPRGGLDGHGVELAGEVAGGGPSGAGLFERAGCDFPQAVSPVSAEMVISAS